MGRPPGTLAGGNDPESHRKEPPMPPRILPVLDRLRQDQSDLLTPPAIEDACRQEGYSWRKRLLDPVTTISLFLLQVLHGTTGCSSGPPRRRGTPRPRSAAGSAIASGS